VADPALQTSEARLQSADSRSSQRVTPSPESLELSMSPAIASAVWIVAYLALFTFVGLTFLFFNLLLGKFLRTANPFP
jgi:hypothetical protein